METCKHSWLFVRSQQGKRQGITTTVDVYVCGHCSRNKYKSLLGYCRVAGLHRQHIKALDAMYFDAQAQLQELRDRIAKERLENEQAVNDVYAAWERSRASRYV